LFHQECKDEETSDPNVIPERYYNNNV